MKKILLVGNYGQGFYNFKKEFVEELLEQNYEVHFAVPWYERLQELVDKGAVYHEIFIDRRGINPTKDILIIRQFQNLFRSVSPNIVVLHTIKPNIYGSYVAKQQGIPYINNITGLGSALQKDNALARLLRWMYRVTLKQSAGIFFENEGNQQYFSKYNIGKKDVYHIVKGAGVNTGYYMCRASNVNGRTEEKFSEGNQIEDKEIVFLCIARIMREKGIVEFLDAAEHITKKYNNVRFQLVGFYDEEDLKERVNELHSLEIVEYLGASKDTRVQMANADCIVLPSYHEGMSNVLLEGAASGLPLITTNIPGCKEAVCEGITGFLCEPRNAQSLIDAIEKFLELSVEERIEMGRNGREKMIREFDRKLVVSEYIKVIEKIV